MDAYAHLRMLVSLIVGLAIARTLSGLSRRLQEPDQSASISSQIIWSFALLLGTVHFWWWEFSLRLISHWNFWIYIFILSYAALFFLMSTLIYPDHIKEHLDQERFFVRRRKAFFVLFLLSFGFDILDTLLKGREHLETLGPWYFVRTGVGAAIALIAMRMDDSRHLRLLGIAWLACNALWITMLYSELI